jgi:hypothetical protein
LFLTVSAFNLAWWLFGALLTVLSFITALKRSVERATERHCDRRRARRVRALERHASIPAPA